ncbi:TIGR03089 family protein [Frankia sp. Cr1]|uniref:TIGR03089 family protein n=1 Tax=Frankia sp. Cr1 TaxID=3073931 RepID=UPI002AD512E0|nr:TIGR03089 family protein [Frankia sp. Cr1]
MTPSTSPASTSPAGRLLDGVVDRVLDAALAAIPPDAVDPAAMTDRPGMTDTAGADGVAALLAHRVRADSARPLLTFYDDATGERTELSAATVDNWVAKTANLLVDTLGLAPGDTIRIALPPHWQTTVVLLAAWSSGAHVTVTRSDADADADADADDQSDPPAAVFLTEQTADAVLAAGEQGDVVALSLRPMGGRLARPMPGVLDFAGEVLAHGDRFTPPRPPANQRILVRLAGYYARAWDLSEHDRILTTAGYDTPQGLLAGLLCPLAAGASLVICRNLDHTLLDRRVAAERVTAVCGPMPGMREATSDIPAAAPGVPAHTPAGTRRLGAPLR